MPPAWPQPALPRASRYSLWSGLQVLINSGLARTWRLLVTRDSRWSARPHKPIIDRFYNHNTTLQILHFKVLHFHEWISCRLRGPEGSGLVCPLEPQPPQLHRGGNAQLAGGTTFCWRSQPSALGCTAEGCGQQAGPPAAAKPHRLKWCRRCHRLEVPWQHPALPPSIHALQGTPDISHRLFFPRLNCHSPLLTARHKQAN